MGEPMPHSTKVELRNGVLVTQLGLGTAPLAGLFSSVSQEEGQATVDAALGMGINYLDTAPHYGKGTAERRLGKYLQNYPRNSFVLSTKVGRLLVPTIKSTDPDFEDADQSVDRVFDFSESGIFRSLEESLERLNQSSVEMVLIHDPDDYADAAITQAYPALEKLRAQGVIKLIGIGMNQSAIPTRFVNETDIDFVLIAGRYTLLDQSATFDLLPAAVERGVDVIAAGVFNSGILANAKPGATYDYAPASSEILARAQQLEAILGQFDVKLEEAAIQFPLRHPAVKVVLTGCRSASEVQANIDAFDAPIPNQAWQAIDEFLGIQREGGEK